MGRFPGGRGMMWHKNSFIVVATFAWLLVLAFVALYFEASVSR